MEYYFKTDQEWRTWLSKNYHQTEGIYLIFYKLENEQDSMRWEEAVKVALCYGWIDSVVKSLGNGKRKQYFSPRKPKSVWSALNKRYIKALIKDNLMHDHGLKSIAIAKENGSWTALDKVEKGIIPEDLQRAFDDSPEASNNYANFSPSYRKQYLYWLNQAKTQATREKRIAEIIEFCEKNIKSRYTR
ncbi:MAG: YdeI/OmpD-associated family protein [Psychroserpens sp.]|uniref:YdeI/OmpD-associated family protein n=1 Tax=Psychroserpens sp. TaxID=2020870 RepID=UPI003C70AD53